MRDWLLLDNEFIAFVSAELSFAALLCTRRNGNIIFCSGPVFGGGFCRVTGGPTLLQDTRTMN